MNFGSVSDLFFGFGCGSIFGLYAHACVLEFEVML